MIILSPRTALFALSLCTPLLASCERAAAPQPAAIAKPAAASTTAAATSPGTSPETVLGRTVDSAMRKARTELETRNLDLSHGVNISVGQSDHTHTLDHTTSPPLPRAEITPQGDFLVEGKAVSVTPAQRGLLLSYRRQVIAIAETGMAIGVQGADLAGKAVLEVMSGVLHDNADAAGKHIEAEGNKIATNAKQICRQLPPMLATQQQLATTLPAFAPYAKMKQSDIDDCMKGDGASVTSQ